MKQLEFNLFKISWDQAQTGCAFFCPFFSPPPLPDLISFFDYQRNLFDLFTVIISLLSLFSSLNINSVRYVNRWKHTPIQLSTQFGAYFFGAYFSLMSVPSCIL